MLVFAEAVNGDAREGNFTLPRLEGCAQASSNRASPQSRREQSGLGPRASAMDNASATTSSQVASTILWLESTKCCAVGRLGSNYVPPARCHVRPLSQKIVWQRAHWPNSYSASWPDSKVKM